MAIKINEQNYNYYKLVFNVIWHRQLIDTTPNLTDTQFSFSPTEVLNQWEAKSKKLAISGLKAGLNDLLSMIKQNKESTLLAIEADLKQHGLISLNKLLAIMRGTVKRIIKNQKIKSLTEYYIIKELLDDTLSEITEEERQILENLMFTFEQRSASNNKKKNDR